MWTVVQRNDIDKIYWIISEVGKGIVSKSTPIGINKETIPESPEAEDAELIFTVVYGLKYLNSVSFAVITEIEVWKYRTSCRLF